ncbi:hypothetical protein HELRODRAFT_184574 [Helobdella robusta]|uniref:Uncharacterized protein n=1 Tax=Helobdella robusta TaxID=6412 RepID=T1FLI3_HELRO|nr:hypothetical protein HELRODRAFT_184574 [Helobdella robusta]ESO09674.1 hypothetical protein HELRODRAFT_184574 [Helobdella robusta]
MGNGAGKDVDDGYAGGPNERLRLCLIISLDYLDASSSTKSVPDVMLSMSLDYINKVKRGNSWSLRKCLRMLSERKLWSCDFAVETTREAAVTYYKSSLIGVRYGPHELPLTMERWAEHYVELCRTKSDVTAAVFSKVEGLPTMTELHKILSKTELSIATDKLSNGKAIGGEIPLEIIKTGKHAFTETTSHVALLVCYLTRFERFKYSYNLQKQRRS